MTLRRRFALSFAAIAAIVAILVGALSFVVTARSLRSEIDRTLTAAAATFAAGGTLQLGITDVPAANADGPARGVREGILQTAESISPTGRITVLIGTGAPIPADARDLQLAAEPATGVQSAHDRTVNDVSFRTLTRSLGSGKGAVMVARNLDENVRVLRRQAIGTSVVGLLVVLLAGIAGGLIARRLTRRLDVLTEVAETVSSTGRLDVPIAPGGSDEVGRLGAAMGSMLTDLARAREDQQRLVQNAGHELRTPLTSLRTNARVLRRFSELSPGSQRRLLDDVESETKELTDLINEIIELATDRRDAETPEPVDLAALAEQVAQTFRRRADRPITVALAGIPESAAGDTTSGEQSAAVEVRPHSVHRALSNLVDNALKFDPGGREPVEIIVQPAGLWVLDRGPGIPPEDSGRIFDRFYRSVTARSLPGSGLGLSIVTDTAQAHGGTVSAVNRPGGGAAIGFSLRPGALHAPI